MIMALTGLQENSYLKIPKNTAFSFDVILPYNACYAIIANNFIKVIDQEFVMNVSLVDTEYYRCQYVI